MSVANTTSPLVLPSLIAERIAPGSENAEERENLVNMIADIQVETAVVGANVLTVSLTDPELQVVTNGLLACNEEGELPEVEIELYGVHYLLADVQGTTDLTQPNIVLEFQTRGVVWLRKMLGPKKATRGTKVTRAEFLKARTVETSRKYGEVRFFSPELNKIQPIGESTLNISGNERAEKKFGGIAAAAPNKAEKNKAGKTKKAKAPGKAKKALSTQVAKNLTVGGSPMSATQVSVAQELLDVAQSHNAGPLATEALIYAAIGETRIGESAGTYVPNEANCSGVLQEKDCKDPHDTKGLAERFLLGSSAFQKGGAIALSKKVSNPEQIAVEVEVPSIWPKNSYAEESGGSNFLAEAKAIIAANGGSSSGTGSSSKEREGPYEFEIADGEDYWTGFQKLTSDVQWLIWFEGNLLRYMQAFQLIKAKPLCTIDVVKKDLVTDFTVDPKTGKRKAAHRNITQKGVVSAFTFDVNNGFGKKGARASQSDISIGGISTECTMDLVCKPSFVVAGDVIVLTDPEGHAPWSTGPWDGRWIVLNATRSVFNNYTELTLGIPGTTALPAPLDEPRAQSIVETTPPSALNPAGSTPSNSGGKSTSSVTPGALGSGSGEAAKAFNASDALSRKQLPYIWAGGHGSGQLGNILTRGLDCSGSVCWVLHEAGMFPSTAAVVSGELENWGSPGEGNKEMIVWANANHTFIEFNIPGHQRAQLNTNGPQNGPRLYTMVSGKEGSYNPHPSQEGYTARHWDRTSERFSSKLTSPLGG